MKQRFERHGFVIGRPLAGSLLAAWAIGAVARGTYTGKPPAQLAGDQSHGRETAKLTAHSVLALLYTVVQAINDQTADPADNVALNPYLLPRVCNIDRSSRPGVFTASNCCDFDSCLCIPNKGYRPFLLASANTSQWRKAV
jgi:hypothetical protein